MPPKIMSQSLQAAASSFDKTHFTDLRDRFASLTPASEAGALPATPKADIGLEQRLIQRVTMGWTRVEQGLIDDIGYDAYLETQLDDQSLDDQPLEEVLRRALPTLSLSAAELYRRYVNDLGVPISELWLATLFRAVFSPRQLFERAVHFWSDHFNISILDGGGPLLKPVDDREVIRRHALGNFRDLLHASARSPAMLSYLTNDTNTKEHPNENYARELMELHALGAEGGYDERDVKEVARCFTGWTIRGPDSGSNALTFVFDATAHDTGQKRVLGHTIPAGGGIEDGERVLDILAAHPSTARLVSSKLLRYFWGYGPSRSWINHVAQTFTDSGGDIRAVLRQVLRKARINHAAPKLKRPFHLVASAVRALHAEITEPALLIEELFALGHMPFTWAAPDGFPDNSGYWSGYMLPRWSFAGRSLGSSAAGVEMSMAFFPPGLNDAQIADRINIQLFNRTMSRDSKRALRDFLTAGTLDDAQIREALALGVAAPDFQWY